MGSAPRGYPAAWSREVLFKVDVRCVFLLSLIFYKTYTNIIRKFYMGLRFGLVCMECREPRHNRHTVSLMTCRVVVPPNARGAMYRLRN